MKADVKIVTINGIEYVPKDTIAGPVIDPDSNYVIIRTYSAGIHTGYLKGRIGKEVVLENARRIHYWNGAASLSQMAVDGVSKPRDCRFSVIVPEITLTEAIEIIPCTTKAKTVIEGVPEWKI